MPSGGVEDHEHVEVVTRKPRRAGGQLTFERLAERAQLGERFRIPGPHVL